jgi:hypothetical protein
VSAGSITVTQAELFGSGGVRQCSVNWLSNVGGTTSGNTFTMGAGSIVLVEFTPGTGGATPTNLYSVDLLDSLGVSVFDNGSGTSIGASLSSTSSSRKVPFTSGASGDVARTWLPPGAYQLVVTNAGSQTQGTVTIYQLPTAI